MRIGIDAYPLTRNGAGISNYLYNLIVNLEKIDSENEYYLYSCPGIKLPFNNPRWHIRVKKGLINKSSTIWMQTYAKRDTFEDKIDIFWSPEQICPLNLAKNIKLLITIHDLTFVYFPQTMSVHNLILHRLFFKKSLGRANDIITVSNSTANDIRKEFSYIKKEKIKVIYNAAGEDIYSISIKEPQERLRKQFDLFKKYILFVGTIEPRKNIESLIKAYNGLEEGVKDEFMLVIVGKKGWKNSSVFRLCQELGLKDNQIRFLGYVSRRDLLYLYSAASLFVLPSLHEGFGIPLLEAMICKAPILCSDIPVFREIAEDSAHFVDATNVHDLSRGIRDMLQDKELIAKLINRGLQRNQFFSWSKSARQVLEVFHKNK